MATSSPPLVDSSPLERARIQWLTRLLGPLAALAVVVLFFGAAELSQLFAKWSALDGTVSFVQYYQRHGTFFTAQNGRNLLVQAAPVAVAARWA